MIAAAATAAAELVDLVLDNAADNAPITILVLAAITGAP